MYDIIATNCLTPEEFLPFWFCGLTFQYIVI